MGHLLRNNNIDILKNKICKNALDLGILVLNKCTFLSSLKGFSQNE